jgi:hypothetical protein
METARMLRRNDFLNTLRLSVLAVLLLYQQLL